MSKQFKIATLVLVVVIEAIVGVYVILIIASSIEMDRLNRSRTRVVPVKKEFLLFPPDADLDNFYEPVPNSTDTQRPQWLGHEFTYTINADGLNERYDYAAKKEPGVYRIVAMGDSFTFGQNVNTAQNWPELLEDHLNNSGVCAGIKFEVINIGMMGYDLLFTSYRYKVRGAKYDPDLVIWWVNDHNFKSMPQLFKGEADKIWDTLTPQDIEEAEQRGEFGIAWERARDAVARVVKYESIVEQEYASLYDFAEHYDGPLVLASHYVEPPNLALIKLFRLNRKHPTYVFDTVTPFDKEKKTAVADGHPSITGYAQMAAEIFSYIRVKNLLPCNTVKNKYPTPIL